MSFPSSPSNNDLHTQFGRTFKYASATNSWSAATPDAPVDTTPTTQGYVDEASLPLTGVVAGSKAFVQDGNKLFIFTGSGWFEIATINTSPTITTDANASYTLTAGTPTVITLQASDPEGTPIVWGYQVTSGSLADTTVSNVDNVFTVTPGSTETTFGLTFTASDGVNIDTSASSFTLEIGPTGNLLYSIANPNQGGHYANTPRYDYFGNAVAINSNYFAVAATGETYPANGAASTAIYVFNLSDGSSAWTRLPTQQGDKCDQMRMNSTKLFFFTGNNNYIYSYTLSNSNYEGSSYISGAYTFLNMDANDNYVIASYTTSNSLGGLRVMNTGLGTLRNITPAAPVANFQDFGAGVAIYGTYAYVGTPVANGTNGSTSNVGLVQVYDVTTGALVQNVPCPVQTQYQHFGRLVAASADYVAVYSSWVSKIYIYNRADMSLRHTLYGIVSNNVRKTSFYADGKYLAFSSYSANGNVKLLNMDTGVVVTTITNPNMTGDTSNDDYFGHAVSIHNKKTVASSINEIGPGNDTYTGAYSGAVYVFE